MADLSKIRLNGENYNFKDAEARTAITTMALTISENRITLTSSLGTTTYIDLPIYNGGVE